MRPDVSANEVLDLVFWLDREGAQPDASVLRLTECVGALRPPIVRQGENFTDITVVFALAAILVELTDEAGENLRTAMLLRNCAKVLELKAQHHGMFDGMN